MHTPHITRVFDFETTVHHDVEAGVGGEGGPFITDDSKLKPQSFGANGYGFSS